MSPYLIAGYIVSFLAILFLAYTAVPWIISKWVSRGSSKATLLSYKLEDMFVFIKEKRLNVVIGLFPLVLGLAGFIFWKLLGMISGVVLGFVLPMVFLRMAVTRRKEAFIKQLIDGLMILSSCLKGGLSLIQAFEVLVEETTPPISQEFGLLIREVKVGVSMEEALERLTKRMPSDELNLFVSAILVARETGGDLTKVFSRLVSTLRDRSLVKEEVLTLTTQGRIQAIIMSLLPIGFCYWVYRVNPQHFDVMFKTDLGRMLMIVAGVLFIIGLILLKIFSTVNI